MFETIGFPMFSSQNPGRCEPLAGVSLILPETSLCYYTHKLKKIQEINISIKFQLISELLASELLKELKEQ